MTMSGTGVTSESDIEMEDTQFLNDITTRKAKSPHKRFHLPRTSRCAPAIIIGLSFLSVALLVALIVVATQSKQSTTVAEQTTTGPGGTERPEGTGTESSTGTSPTSTVATEHHVWDNIRLPGDIVPLEYLINLHPNLTTELVEGNVLIDVEVLNSTSVVIIHARDMNITVSSVTTASGHVVSIEESFFVESTQFYVMKLKQSLHPQKGAQLEFHWQSKLSTSLAGFYKSTYTSKDGKTQ